MVESFDVAKYALAFKAYATVCFLFFSFLANNYWINEGRNLKTMQNICYKMFNWILWKAVFSKKIYKRILIIILGCIFGENQSINGFREIMIDSNEMHCSQENLELSAKSHKSETIAFRKFQEFHKSFN